MKYAVIITQENLIALHGLKLLIGRNALQYMISNRNASYLQRNTKHNTSIKCSPAVDMSLYNRHTDTQIWKNIPAIH